MMNTEALTKERIQKEIKAIELDATLTRLPISAVCYNYSKQKLICPKIDIVITKEGYVINVTANSVSAIESEIKKGRDAVGYMGTTYKEKNPVYTWHNKTYYTLWSLEEELIKCVEIRHSLATCAFDDYLNDEESEMYIAGISIFPSDALYEMYEDDYWEKFEEWGKDDIENVIESLDGRQIGTCTKVFGWYVEIEEKEA